MIRKYQQPQQAAHTQLPSVKRLYFLGSRIVSDFAITTTGCSDGSRAGRYKTLPADGGRHHRRRRRRHVYDVKFPFVCLFAFFLKKRKTLLSSVSTVDCKLDWTKNKFWRITSFSCFVCAMTKGSVTYHFLLFRALLLSRSIPWNPIKFVHSKMLENVKTVLRNLFLYSSLGWHCCCCRSLLFSFDPFRGGRKLFHVTFCRRQFAETEISHFWAVHCFEVAMNRNEQKQPKMYKNSKWYCSVPIVVNVHKH